MVIFLNVQSISFSSHIEQVWVLQVNPIKSVNTVHLNMFMSTGYHLFSLIFGYDTVSTIDSRPLLGKQFPFSDDVIWLDRLRKYMTHLNLSFVSIICKIGPQDMTIFENILDTNCVYV